MPSPLLNRIILSPSLDPATIDYRNRILAIGGTIIDSSLKAVDVFIKGCKANGIWELLIDAGVFAGSNLNAALVKLKYPSNVISSYINNNFLGADYSETTGLNPGTNTNKHLQTGILTSALNSNSCYVAAWNYNVSAISDSGASLGTAPISNFSLRVYPQYNGSYYAACFQPVSATNQIIPRTINTGLFAAAKIGTSSGYLQQNNNFTNNSNATTLPSANTEIILGNDTANSGSRLKSRISFACVAQGLSTAQATTFYNLVAQLQTALGRGI